jgi:hypothetical protein
MEGPRRVSYEFYDSDPLTLFAGSGGQPMLNQHDGDYRVKRGFGGA